MEIDKKGFEHEGDSNDQVEENNNLDKPNLDKSNSALDKQLFAGGKNKKAKGFRAFNVKENIIQAIKQIGYKFPTPIQRRTIPDIISGFNVIAHSRTGSGKTAAFLIPILNRLKEHSKVVGCRCLILSPTRELAHQTLSFCKKLGKFMNLRFTLLVGGNELEGQFEKLAQNPDIIIATPGRVMHHLNEGSLSLKKIEILAIDEADKIFELNFEEQVKAILKNCPMSRQVLLFSATIPQQLAQFMKTGIREYKLINIDEENKIPDKLKIHLIHSRSEEKKFALISLLTNNIIDTRRESTLIFVSTKYHCEYIHEFLKFWRINSSYIYGQMDQELRNKNLENFRKKYINILVVTDVAARGLDIPMLENVINFDFPDTTKLFIHRVGRTARAGREGRVFNLINPSELAYFFDIKVSLGKSMDIHVKDMECDLSDFNKISFGVIPQIVLNGVKESKEDFLNAKFDMETLEDTCKKAYTKALLFRQKPSKFGIKQAKKLIAMEAVQPHPLFTKAFDSNETMKDEMEKMTFLSQLKNFKPKESYFERVNETNVKEDVIKDFKKKADEFKRKKEIEKRKEEMKENMEEDFEDEMIEDDDNTGKNIKKPGTTAVSPKQFLGKKLKRSQIRNFRNNPNYISEKKENNTSLWGDEKPITLDELTLNIAPDDDSLANKKRLVWDPKKKNFVNSNVDKTGKIIKNNEAGVRVKSKDKNPHSYQKWKKKNRLRVQNVGEMENDKITGTADTMFKERKLNKSMKGSKTGDSKKGKNEVKNFDQLLKAKKEKFKKQFGKNFSKKAAKERQIRERSNLNRKSQVFIRRRRK